MLSVLDAIFRFIAITSIVWVPLAILSLLSTKLVELIGRRWTIALGIFSVPLHELSHALMCLLCNHKIVGMSLFTFRPSIDGTLGYVNHQYRKSWFSPFALLLIGVAPVFGGVLGLYCVTSLLRPDLLEIINRYQFFVTDLNGGFNVLAFFSSAVIAGNVLHTIVWGLLCFSIALFCVPSRADFQSCKTAVLVMLAMFVGIALLFPQSVETLTMHIGGWLIVIALPFYIALGCLIIGALAIIGLKRAFQARS